MGCSVWAVNAEVAQGLSSPMVRECLIGAFPANKGIVLLSPNGRMYARFHVDNDGTVLFDPLGPSYSSSGDELILTSPGAGLCVYAPSAPSPKLTRIRIDNDGVGGTEPASISQWATDVWPGVGQIGSDVIITGIGFGGLFTTPDGNHVYRVRVDLDAQTIVSELIA